MVHRPIGENGAAVNKFAFDRAEHARVVRTDAMVAHHEITVFRHAHGTEIAHVLVLHRDVRFEYGVAVDVNDALTNLDALSRQTDDALYERFRTVERIPENDDVATLNRLEAINEFVDEDALLVGRSGAMLVPSTFTG
jgi:hypothetical protein